MLSFLKRSSQVQSPFRIKNIQKYSTSFPVREFEEIQISVPWGHVAGKWYGSKDKRPIVGLHGWQDNAGTFDTLAPFLPSDVSFLAIDLPGHGLSSWLPDGCSYHTMDHVNILFKLMREFNWKKISIIGHSMGAVDGLVFASHFPDKCDMFVALDIVQPLLGKKGRTINLRARGFEAFNKEMEIYEQKTQPPSYEIDELIEKMHKANGGSITKELYDFILKRNIKLSESNPKKYLLTRDGRLKSMIFNIFPNVVLEEMAQRMTCPHLFIKAKRSMHYDSEAELAEVMKAFKENPAFEKHLVDGTHYVHLNEPQKIAAILNPFINKYRFE